MLVPRKHVSAAVLDGFLYAVGGIMDNKDLCSVEMYDPTIEEWGPVASLSKCKGRQIVNFRAVNTNNQILFQKNFKIAKIDLRLQ